MLKAIFVSLLLIPPIVTIAQTSRLDSLQRRYLELKDNDTSKVLVLIQAANDILYIEYNPDSTIAVCEKALNLANTIKYEKGQSYAYNYLGRSYLLKRLHNTALQNFLKSLKISELLGDKEVVAITHLEIANIYSSLMFSFEGYSSDQMFQEALFHRRKFYTMSLELQNNEMIAAACDALGSLFLGHKEYDSAEYYYTQGTKIGREKGLEISGELNLVEILLRKGEHESAKRKCNTIIKNLHLHKPGSSLITEESIVSDLYAKMVELYSALNQFDSAQYYMDLARSTYASSKDQLRKLSLENGQASLFNSTKQYDKAIALCLQTISLAQRKDNLLATVILPAYSLLETAYKGKKDHEKAYDYLSKFFALKDSIFNSNISDEVLRQQADFEIASKNTELDLVAKEKSIAQLTLSRQKLMLMLFIIALILTIIVAFILNNRYKIIQQSKNEQERIYKELDTLKSRFFANISHEFRTPLTLILGPVQKRLNRAETTEEKVELSLVHRNAQRLLKLVNQLLDLSKLEAGSMKLVAHKDDLVSFTRLLTQSFHSMAEARAIRYTVTTETESIEVYFDPEKLEKIINNLLSNAFKFTPTGGEVNVTIQKHPHPDPHFKEGFAEIQVQDTGIGISAEHLEKIFDRFYQIDSSQTREYEGTGIGLALTKELVELHHGIINVTSHPDTGSLFSVKLPLGYAHLKSDEHHKTPPIANTVTSSYADETNLTSFSNPATEAHAETLIIVEDNADLRYYLVENLAPYYCVLEASNGEDGLMLAYEKIPNLIISDLMMPKMDGIQLSTQLKQDERTSHIPIILLTAKADIEAKIQGLELGADDYISKPFEMKELLVRVRNLIETRKNLRLKYAGNVALHPKKISAKSIDDRFMQKIMDIIEKNISNTSFGVETFAVEAGMSGAQLYRKLTALTGYSPNDFIRHMRLQRAADLLKQKAGNVAEVAYQVGFNNLSYFSKCFKEKFGKTPSEYAKF